MLLALHIVQNEMECIKNIGKWNHFDILGVGITWQW
jgi:hypothetical protein